MQTSINVPLIIFKINIPYYHETNLEIISCDVTRYDIDQKHLGLEKMLKENLCSNKSLFYNPKSFSLKKKVSFISIVRKF